MLEESLIIGGVWGFGEFYRLEFCLVIIVNGGENLGSQSCIFVVCEWKGYIEDVYMVCGGGVRLGIYHSVGWIMRNQMWKFREEGRGCNHKNNMPKNFKENIYKTFCGCLLLPVWNAVVNVGWRCYGLTNAYKKLEGTDMLLKKTFFGFVMSCVLVGRSAIPETNIWKE